jgi:hypothetical protein
MARRRLTTGTSHPAANRDFTLYRRLRAAADPIPSPKLTINTDDDPADVLARCLSLLRNQHSAAT